MVEIDHQFTDNKFEPNRIFAKMKIKRVFSSILLVIIFHQAHHVQAKNVGQQICDSSICTAGMVMEGTACRCCFDCRLLSRLSQKNIECPKNVRECGECKPGFEETAASRNELCRSIGGPAIFPTELPIHILPTESVPFNSVYPVMWISFGIVGVIVVVGFAVASTRGCGRLRRPLVQRPSEGLPGTPECMEMKELLKSELPSPGPTSQVMPTAPEENEFDALQETIDVVLDDYRKPVEGWDPAFGQNVNHVTSLEDGHEFRFIDKTEESLVGAKPCADFLNNSSATFELPPEIQPDNNNTDDMDTSDMMPTNPAAHDSGLGTSMLVENRDCPSCISSGGDHSGLGSNYSTAPTVPMDGPNYFPGSDCGSQYCPSEVPTETDQQKLHVGVGVEVRVSLQAHVSEHRASYSETFSMT